MGTAFVFARARAGYEKALKGELKGIKNVSEVYLIKPDRGEPYDVMAKFHVSSKFEFDKIRRGFKNLIYIMPSYVIMSAPERTIF